LRQEKDILDNEGDEGLLVKIYQRMEDIDANASEINARAM